MTPTTIEALPPLPHWTDATTQLYTADQMRDYARAALASQAAPPVAPEEARAVAPLTDEDCDKAAAQAMDRVAAKKNLHALELNPDITAHHTLRRELVRAGYAIAAPRIAEPAAEPLTDSVVERLACEALLFAGDGPDLWQATTAGLLVFAEKVKQLAPPAGYKLVPITPTPEMLAAGTAADWVGEVESRAGRSIGPDVDWRYNTDDGEPEEVTRPGIWAAMLAAV